MVRLATNAISIPFHPYGNSTPTVKGIRQRRIVLVLKNISYSLASNIYLALSAVMHYSQLIVGLFLTHLSVVSLPYALYGDLG